MSIFKKDVLLDFDDDIVLPFTNEWKTVYNFVVKKIRENSANASALENDLNENIEIIIKDGEGYEDIVLKTAMLYFLVKNTNFDMQELEQNYSQSVINGVKLLHNDNNIKGLDDIFLNKQYAYLNKIKLAEYIVMLKQLNHQIVDKIKALAKVDNVIKNYKTKTHKKLMGLLIETRNNIK